MSWSKDDPGTERRGYHHGNLREALIRAALELIAQKGPAGFTFADAARWAGVSSAAPYRHFRDRDALMVDVARRGFERFAAALDRAWDDGRPDPLAAFQNLGRAYVDFARSDASYYSAMFEAGLAPDAEPGLQQAADRAFAVLRKASEAVCTQLGIPPEWAAHCEDAHHHGHDDTQDALGARLDRHLDAGYFRNKFGADIFERWNDVWTNYIDEGYIERQGDEVRVTPPGLLRVDSLLPPFFEPQFQGVRYT